MTPNSTKILQRWGLDAGLWDAAAEPTSLTVHRYSGKVLAHEDGFDGNMRARYGAPFLDMHRVDLQLALYRRAQDLGVVFRLGEQVDSVDLDRAEITVKARSEARSPCGGCGSGPKSGTGIGSESATPPSPPPSETGEGEPAARRFQADVIVAADGVWSRLQACFLGRESPPLPTGDLAYRVVLSVEQAEADPELAAWISNPTVHFWIGPGAHAVGYSMRAGRLYNVVLLVPDDLPEGVSRQPGSVEEMKALFADWDPILRRFLDKIDTVEKWRLMHSE